MAHGIACLITLVLFVCAVGSTANAKPRRDSYVPSANDLFKEYKPATIKITIKQNGVPNAVGTGFFLSNDGLVVTNHHVIRNVIASADFTAEFELADGKVLKDFTVYDCGDKRGLDVCLLKLNAKPKAFFTLTDRKVNAGDDVNALGHPRGLDFTLTRGKITATRASAVGVEELEITAPLGPGNSGGPLFDDFGRLVGVATKFWPDRNNVNFGISAKELATYRETSPDPMAIAQARALIADRVRGEMGKKSVAEVDPVLATVIKGRSLAEAPGFRLASFEFDEQIIQVLIPAGFEACHEARAPAKDTRLYACVGFGDSAVFTVQRTKRREELRFKDGKKLVEAKPTLVTQTLIDDGHWDAFAQKLGDKEKRGFYSQPSLAECRTVGNKTPDAFFTKEMSCRFDVTNDAEARARSFNLWVEKGDYVYSFAAWVADPSMEEFFTNIPTVAVLTARPAKGYTAPRALASTLVNKRLESYTLTPPKPFAFMGGKPGKNGAHTDLFGKQKPLGDFEESYILAISSAEESVLPPKYDQLALKLTQDSAKDLSLVIKPMRAEPEAFKVSGKPARLVFSSGKNRLNQDVVVLTAVVIEGDRAHVIMQITVGEDSTKGYQELKELLKTFALK